MHNWTGFSNFGGYNPNQGTVLTPQQAIKTSELDWPVEKFQAYADVNGEMVEIPGQVFTFRMDSVRPFPGAKSVGSGYEVINNVDAFQFLYDLVDSDGLVIENAMELKQGKLVVVVARIPEHVIIGDDQFNRYMVFGTGHDGQHAANAFGTNVCVVCENTYEMAKGQAKYVHSIRHTRSAELRLQDAREAIKLSFKKTENLQVIANQLLAEKIDKDFYNNFMRDIVQLDKIDKNKQPRKHRSALGTRYNLHNMWKTLPYIDNYRDRKWSLLQVATDYDSNVRKYKNAESRFNNLMSGPEISTRALELLTA